MSGSISHEYSVGFVGSCLREVSVGKCIERITFALHRYKFCEVTI